MGIDLIDQHLQPQLMRPGDQGVKISQRAKGRINRAVIGNIIAKVLHRRGKKGRYPDGINAQIGDVVQPPGDAGKIAHPIAIAILKAARIDLINCRPAPPVGMRSVTDWGHCPVLQKALRAIIPNNGPTGQHFAALQHCGQCAA
jgi:hypothetical protein